MKLGKTTGQQGGAHHGGGPQGATGELLVEHGVQDGHHPVLEGAVVAVGHQQIPDPVEALLPQFRPAQLEVARVGGPQALCPKPIPASHYVFIYTAFQLAVCSRLINPDCFGCTHVITPQTSSPHIFFPPF